MKSYGRAPTFLLRTGYEQVRSVVAALAGDWEARAASSSCCPRPASAAPTAPRAGAAAAACCGSGAAAARSSTPA